MTTSVCIAFILIGQTQKPTTEQKEDLKKLTISLQNQDENNNDNKNDNNDIDDENDDDSSFTNKIIVGKLQKL